MPQRVLFRRPRFRGDLESEAHNEWKLLLWARWLAPTPSALPVLQYKATQLHELREELSVLEHKVSELRRHLAAMSQWPRSGRACALLDHK